METILALIVGFLLGKLWQKKERATFNGPKKDKKDWLPPPEGVAQFFEPVSDKEKFNSANKITDLLT